MAAVYIERAEFEFDFQIRIPRAECEAVWVFQLMFVPMDIR